MHSSSESIGTIAAALAKAQAELTNPEKSLIATIRSAFPRDKPCSEYMSPQAARVLSAMGALDDATLRRAMTYGSAVASYWVEEFGCEGADHLTRDEIEERYEAFRSMTAVEGVTTG